MSKYLLPKVPRPYVLVEYITNSSSTGSSASYIDTDLVLGSGDDIEIAFQSNYYTTTSPWVFGSRKTVTKGYALDIQPALVVVAYGGNNTINDVSLKDQVKHTVTVKNGIWKADGVQIYDGSELTFAGDGNCLLFGMTTTDGAIEARAFSGNIFGFKAWRSDSLIANFVPVKNTQTNEYGMYDLVTELFYGNSGTGSFTGGDEIKLREYLESNGAQYITLPYGFNNTDEIEIKTKLGSVASDKFLIAPTTWNDNNNRFGMGGTNNNNRAVGYGNNNTGVTTYSPKITSVIGQITAETYKNYLFTITGEDIESDKDVSTIAFGSETDALKLFYGYDSTTSGAIYYFKQKKANGDELDLIPITVGTTGAMYDLVSNKIYYNSGSGSFTYGDVVNPLEVKQFINEKVNERIAPSGYKLLEYIETTHNTLTNAAPVIKTDIIPNQDTICYIDYKQNISYTSPSGGVWIFGARTSSSSGEYGLVVGSDGLYASPYNTASGRNTFQVNNTSVSNDTNRHQYLLKVRENGGTSRRFDNQSVDSVTGQTYISYSSFAADHGLWIFGCLDGSTDRNRIAMKLYSFKVWQGLAEELVADMIPVQRTSDNAIGMYDKVEKKFYGNDGAGSFVAGPEVKLVEYIQSSGTQYINTGILPNEFTKAVADIKFNELIKCAMFGSNNGSTGGTGWNNLFAINTDKSQFWCQWGNTYNGAASKDTARHTHTFTKNSNNWTYDVDGTSYTSSDITTQSPLVPMYLFACNNNGTLYRESKANLYSLKLYNGTQLIYDFSPVLIGTEYAMYDKVNGVIYHNKGTGSFTGGNVIIEGGKYLSIKELETDINIPGYERLEYIQSDGNQYIDTLLQGKNGYTFETKLRYTDLPLTYTYAAGFGDSSSNRIYFTRAYKASTDMSNGYTFDGHPINVSSSKISLNTDYTYKSIMQTGKQECYVDGSLIASNTYTEQNAYGTIYLFTSNYNGDSNGALTGRIYYAKFYYDSELVRDFIPVKRLSDNGIGMYDRVNKKFYGNDGTGTFTAGPTIKEVEYIQSTGTQYIDTGILADHNNVKWTIAAQSTKIETSNKVLIGNEDSNAPNFFAMLGNGKWGVGTGSSDYYTNIDHVTKADIIYNIDSTHCWGTVNGLSYSRSATTQAKGNWVLFNSTQGSYYASAKVWGATLTVNNELVLNFIPVKVGTEYAMFDTITQSVFRNSGTDSFTGGQEAKPYVLFINTKEV